MQAQLNNLISEIKKYNPGADFDLIQRAFNFAQKAHEGQLRESGDPYMAHPLKVAMTLAQLRLNSKTISAGLLHDTVDDTPTTIEEIEREFGPEVAFLVSGVSRLGKIQYRGIEDQAEKLRKMFLAMAQDIRVVIIKLADRFHNLETLDFLPEAKQKRIALESLEIYAPLAYRLGMGEMKGQIEDISFPYVYPKEYKWLMKNIKDKYQKRAEYLQKVQAVLQKELKQAALPVFDIHFRAKHHYSLYKKLVRCDMDLNKIYDLVAIRIIAENIKDCYTILGIVHKLWRPLPGRIKDYIATPKPNGYQSIHTTVFCLEGKIVEIQIRTEKMHEEAEFGIAAHWHFSEKKGLKDYLKSALYFGPQKPATFAPEKELIWIKQLQEWQKETEDPEEFLKYLKIDFLKDQIFVFTPNGDIIDLPEGATAVDFAYAIHTDIGNRCAGAKADGKIIALDQPLVNGQIIEIITQKDKGPNRDWLKFIKTSQARSRIKKRLKEGGGPEKPAGTTPEKPQQIRKKTKIETVVPAGQIEIEGESRILTHLAKCCQPQPEDEIRGYITVSRGVSVHKSTCRNLRKIKNTDKFIDVSWKR